MIAVVVVRDGVLPAGASEAVAEAGGRVLVIGSGPVQAAKALCGVTYSEVYAAGTFRAAGFAEALAGMLVDEDVIVLPASPDGRDLAPRLAHQLRRPLLSGAVSVSATSVRLAGWGDRIMEDVAVAEPVVVTLQVRGGRAPSPPAEPAPVLMVQLELPNRHDAEVLSVSPADPATMDLSEAVRIVAGGAGLGRREAFDDLARLGASLGASVGATRVVTDAGWLGHERQIGTTGVSIAPELYLAFGISGATQHTGGFGPMEHIVSVNKDPGCPMNAMADLAVVADARAVLGELLARLTPAEVAAGG